MVPQHAKNHFDYVSRALKLAERYVAMHCPGCYEGKPSSKHTDDCETISSADFTLGTAIRTVEGYIQTLEED